jgi:EAL domain-containing protein (putative c-di-GMP-specific phosphodiesterase class I)
VDLSELKGKLQTSISDTVSNQGGGFLVAVELKGISHVLRVYGRKATDEVIESLRKDLASQLASHESIHVMGIDMLYFVLNCGGKTQDVKSLTSRIEALHKIIKLFGSNNFDDTKPLCFTSYMGAVEFPRYGKDVDALIDKCYIALKHVNEDDPHNCASIYKEGDLFSKKSKDYMFLSSFLHKSIKEGRVRLAFQPVVKVQTGEVSYHESLLRLINKSGDIVSAGQFIYAAEKMGMIDEIDEIVFDLVVDELRNNKKINLSFNLSGISVDNPKWLKRTETVLAKHPDIASRVIVEITETAIYKDLGRTAYFVASMQEMGCQVALDDFGAGYTSFRQLKTLSLDILKIDGIFIRDIVTSSDSRLFVKILVDMSDSFGMKAVAEFVENGEIAKILMDLNVSYMQGNYFGPAVNYRSWSVPNLL